MPIYKSYFAGCSTGGQQALSEAQRYPYDYDGILAGDPAARRTRAHMGLLATYAQLKKLKADNLTDLSHYIITTCNSNTKNTCNGYVCDPSKCKDVLQDENKCTDNKEIKICNKDKKCLTLTCDQMNAARSMFDGPEANGKIVEFGVPPGADLASLYGLTNQQKNPEPLFDSLFRWIYGKSWDPSTFKFDTDVETVDNKLGPFLNVDPDQTDFKGKLILYHGWADAVIPWQESLEYYKRYLKRPGHTDGGNSRFYLAPGMAHCFQGTGLNSFGAPFQPPLPSNKTDPQHDILEALVNWVESTVPDSVPQEIMATKNCTAWDNDSVCTKTSTFPERPLCQVEFNSSGDFDCSWGPKKPAIATAPAH